MFVENCWRRRLLKDININLMCYELSGGLFASSIECGPTRLKKQLHSELTSVKEQISGFVQAGYQ